MIYSFSISNLSTARRLDPENSPRPKWSKIWRRLQNEEYVQYLLSSGPLVVPANVQPINRPRILRPSLRQLQSTVPKPDSKIAENAQVTDKFVRPKIAIGRTNPI